VGLFIDFWVIGLGSSAAEQISGQMLARMHRKVMIEILQYQKLHFVFIVSLLLVFNLLKGEPS
jgi:hypothetical protein